MYTYDSEIVNNRDKKSNILISLFGVARSGGQARKRVGGGARQLPAVQVQVGGGYGVFKGGESECELCRLRLFALVSAGAQARQ